MGKLILFAFILCTIIVTLHGENDSSKLSPSLLATLKSKPEVNIIISFTGGNSQVVRSIEGQSFPSKAARIDALVLTLKKESSRSQQNVKYFLQENSMKYRSFWVSNQMYVERADMSLVEYLSSFQEVAEIHEEILIPMHSPVRMNTNEPVLRKPDALQWNIERLQAEEAWKITNGTGVVVAHIDTGVRHTHEALRHNFRGSEYGWYNPYERDATPFDDAPALVSNSWGIGQGDSWYEGVTEAWVAAGIVPIFALGNSGNSCGSTNSPGDLKRVIGVGSTNMEDRLSNFSSVGPAPDGRIKPDVTAPGENILSSLPDNDTAYGIKRGTSMACPHVAGVAALLLSILPDLSFEQVRTALTTGVDTNLTSQNLICDGRSDNLYPNHHYGHGRVNALKVAEAAKLITDN